MAFQNYRLRNVDNWRAFRNRRRSDTSCTAELLDSGIASLNNHGNDCQRKLRRNLQVDDILWCCTFFLTIWIFGIPLTLLTDLRVDWFFLSCSILSQVCFFLVGLYLCSKNDTNLGNEWLKKYPKLFFLAIILSLASCIMFCYATWNVWNYWSIYIVFVTFMFTNVVLSFL